MAVVFGILGILCLMYYGVIVIYSGAGTSFSAIWIILALGFFAAAAVMKFYPRFRDKIPVQNCRKERSLWDLQEQVRLCLRRR